MGLSTEEVLDAVNDGVTYWKKRTDQFEQNLDMFEVKERTIDPGAVAVTDTMPHAAVTLASAIVGRKQPQWTVTPRDDTPEEQTRAARLEQVVNGVNHDWAMRSFRRGDMPPNQENIFNMLGMGWYATRVIVGTDKEGMSPFRALRHYNPWNVIQGPQTADGYSWVATRREVPSGTIKNTPDYKKFHSEAADNDFETHTLIDFYSGPELDSENVVIIDEEEVVRQPHGQPQCPWVTGPVGGHNFRGAVGDTRPYVDKMGMAFTYGMRNMHTYYNELMETLGLIVKKYAKPTVVVKTRDGSLRNIELGSGAINTALLTDLIEVVDVPGAPADMQVLLQTVLQSMYRTTFQETIYGGMPEGGLSGLALTITGHHAGLTLEPYMELLQLYDEEVGSRLLRGIFDAQLSSDFAGRKGDGTPFELRDFSYLEIDGSFKISSTRKLSLPEDDLIRSQVAASVTNPQNPIVSMQYAREKIMLVENPLEERQRIIAELPMRMPNIALAMAYAELVNRNEMVAAELLAQTLGIGQVGQQGPVGVSGGAGNIVPAGLQSGQQVSATQASMQNGQQGQGQFG